MRTCVIVAVLAACCVDEAAASQSAVRSLFKSVCSECHGAETQESGLRLTALVFCDPLSARLPTKASSG
jgi:mono/diheme cytochrome c family protein